MFSQKATQLYIIHEFVRALYLKPIDKFILFYYLKILLEASFLTSSVCSRTCDDILQSRLLA